MKYPKPKTKRQALTVDKKKDEERDGASEALLNVELTDSTRQLLRTVILAVYWTEEDKKFEALCKQIIDVIYLITITTSDYDVAVDEVYKSNKPILDVTLSNSTRRLIFNISAIVNSEESKAKWKKINDEWDSILKETPEKVKKKLH